MAEQQQLEQQQQQQSEQQGPSRSLYFGNIQPNVTYYDVCKLANQYGGLELVKIVPEKKCAFVNFINEEDALRLHNDAVTGTLELCGQKAIVGWAKSTPIKPELRQAIDEGATRNLFVAGIGAASEHVLSALFLQFGDIENIVCMQRKGFGFVNMTSVRKAIEAKTMCETKGIDLAGRKLVVKFAKEGVSARDPRTVVQQQQFAPQGMFNSRARFMQGQPHGFQNQGGRPGGMQGPGMSGSRAIYLGNLPEEVENADLCKLGNRYGQLELIRINKEKKNGFINFIDPSAAEEFFVASQHRPIVLHNQQVRVGWAKSAPLRPEIQEAISQGATRNLYIGGISENINEDHLRELIAPYCHGEFAGIFILREKKIAFVNLISIKAAIQARQALMSGSNPIVLDGNPIKINFAKETIQRQAGSPLQQQQWGEPQFGQQSQHQQFHQPQQFHFQQQQQQQQQQQPFDQGGMHGYDNFGHSMQGNMGMGPGPMGRPHGRDEPQQQQEVEAGNWGGMFGGN